MQDEQIQQKIDSFPKWRYHFDLNGNPTPASQESINRHQQRKNYFFDPMVELLGGSLEGKRVLDLGCNAGFWSLQAVEAGCDYVLGVDGRQSNIDQANFVFEAKEIEDDRYDFIADDLFGVDLESFGEFDVVLCLGLMYHISKHVQIMEKISNINKDVLVVDTSLCDLPGRSMQIRYDDMEQIRNAVDHEMVMAPSWKAVHSLVELFGYSSVTLKPQFSSWRGASDYQGPLRRAYLCAKQTDVSQVSTKIETGPPPSPWKKQRGDQGESQVGRLRRQKETTPAKRNGGGKQKGQNDRELENKMRQVDDTLSQLFSSRRWLLADGLGNLVRLLSGKQGAPTAEDRLRQLMAELRARRQ